MRGPGTLAGIRVPDAVQRLHKRVYARLRRAMAVHRRAGSVPNADVRYGPGSAERHDRRCFASP
jgi:hypothetical protein